MFDFFNPKSPPIIMDGGLPPAPSSVASLSCVSDAAHNNIDDERRNGSTRTIVLFPTQACTDIQESSSSSVGDNNGSNRHQGTALATRDGWESLEPSASDETHISCVETRRSSGSAVLRRNNNRPVPRREEGEERYPGVSTELVLYEDPWKIKKKLKPSDLGHLWRLLLPREDPRAPVDG
ncbi:uncharacterized protein LOC104446504 [Eucalyptus grandis]|uniref:uncharacterized protein LOC104446504 n=1 Tax=Eucalyptus grandis TaxID=71139 RepID=UPI00192E83C0|nr:uncharacterized protein LOC104446504 [Eucalyptus grandis]